VQVAVAEPDGVFVADFVDVCEKEIECESVTWAEYDCVKEEVRDDDEDIVMEEDMDLDSDCDFKQLLEPLCDEDNVYNNVTVEEIDFVTDGVEYCEHVWENDGDNVREFVLDTEGLK
jgi:hypothetical protein